MTERTVTVLAVHVRCTVCGNTASVDQPAHSDTFTQRVLQPLVSWWVAHVGPEIVLLEVEADGEVETWWMTEGWPHPMHTTGELLLNLAWQVTFLLAAMSGRKALREAQPN